MQTSLQPELILNINKPLDWTSFDVVNRIKFHIKRNHKNHKNIKIGHAGTLDPLATGVLVVCLGKATKKIESLQNTRKEYTGIIRLGSTTPSYDLETEFDATYDYSGIRMDDIHKTAQQFIGEQLQYPPVFSAKKINGVRAYEMARAGQEVQMRANTIEIFEFEITSINLPDVAFRIACSKGTYIRSIAHDFGKKLNSGSHLAALCRTASGEFTVKTSTELENVVDVVSAYLNSVNEMT